MVDLKTVIGLGVAGNFVGYLKQVDEEGDYAALPVKEAYAPKGLFPFYVPNAQSYLGVYPYGEGQIRPPSGDPLQAEAELGLLCTLSYDGPQVASVTPTHFAAFNDASMRKKGVAKLSQKKNWGAASKGCAATFLPIDRFSSGGVLDNYRLTAYLQRGADLHAFGADSPVLGYSYFYERLTDWLVECLNTQGEQDPLEDIRPHLQQAGQPAQALICIGAIRYTHFGESVFLQQGDQIMVVAYDGVQYKPSEVEALLKNKQFDSPHMSVLSQMIV
jgi:hypothetical protein